jgi:hypothetical protein
VRVRQYKGNVVHLVPKSGARWIIAWREGEMWVTTVSRTGQRKLIGTSLSDLWDRGASTFASAPGATKRARALGIDPTLGVVR